MLRFDAMDKTIEVRVFTDPRPETPEATESAEEFKVRLDRWIARQDVVLVVALVSRRTFRRWAFAHDKIRAENRARIRELRTQIAIEDDPRLHDETSPYLTEQAAEETEQIMERAIRDAVIQVKGIYIDGLAPDAYVDSEQLPVILQHAGCLAEAFAAVLRAQTPERQDVFC